MLFSPVYLLTYWYEGRQAVNHEHTFYLCLRNLTRHRSDIS